MTLPILVIEDDPGVGEILCAALKGEGYQPERTVHGALASEMVKRQTYGAAVLEVQSWDLESRIVLSGLIDSDPALPIIVVTRNNAQQLRIECLSSGAFACLTPSSTLDELTITLRRAVGGRALAIRVERVERALADSEERFRCLVEAATDAIVLADGGGNVMSMNRAAQTLFSYTEAEVAGTPLRRLLAARSREACQAGIEWVCATRDSRGFGRTMEFDGVKKDGSRFPLELSVASWTAEGGSFYGGIIRDITARKEAEEHLKAQSEQLREQAQLLDLAQVIIRDLEDQILFWSTGAGSLYGWSREEAVGQSSHALLQTKFPKPIAELKAELLREGRWEGELVQVKRDGSRVVVASYWLLHRDKGGQPVGILEVNNDVTQTKRSEELQRIRSDLGLALAMAGSLGEVAPRLLKTVCKAGGWDLGIIWRVDRNAEVLRREASWSRPRSSEIGGVEAFEATMGRSDFRLPARIWRSGKSAWIPDLAEEPDFSRAPPAAKPGPGAACGVPIPQGNAIEGVMVLYSHKTRKSDPVLTEFISGIGIKIGQFLERRRDEERLAKVNECLLGFGKDATDNINRLTALCGELLGGAWAVYGSLRNNLLYSTARWRTPPRFMTVGKPDGLLCAEVIVQGTSEPMVIRHLPETPYARTDPWVLSHNLQTFMGQAVAVGGRRVGALCVVFQRDFTPSESDRRFIGILASALGVEEVRKTAEQALRRAFEDTEKILASLPGAVLVVDDLLLVYANALASDYFGAGRATIVGEPLNAVLPLEESRWSQLVDVVRPEDAGQRRREHIAEFELRERVYRYRAFSVSLRGSERVQVGLMIWDFTDEKHLQDHVMQAEKLASLGTLVSGMAHEVNNPVQGILGNAELIEAEGDLEKIREYARDIIKYSQHVGTIVRDFSSYARPALRDEQTPINLNDRVTQALKMVQRRPQFEQIEVVREFQPLPDLPARRVEIDQALINVISNAVDAMEGQGRLTLKTLYEEESLTVLISDTGPGIPKSLLGRIFDPFFTTKGPEKGTGLGLSIVHRVVTKHGGTVQVETVEGKGTTFVMRFPLIKR